MNGGGGGWRHPLPRILHNDFSKSVEKDILIDPIKREEFLRKREQKKREAQSLEEYRRKFEKWLY